VKGRLAIGAVIGAVLLAGCGGGAKNPVEQALQSSTLTYYNYTDPAWWGRAVKVDSTVVRQSSGQAVATVSVLAGKETVTSQTIDLTKNGSLWAVSGAEVTSTQAEGYFGTISGPTADRPPTAAERAAIVAGGLREFPGEGNCLRFIISVSKVDPAYASVNLRFVGPKRTECATSGVLLFGRNPAGKWRMLEIGTNPFVCHHAPAGVLRSLFGRCWIVSPGVGSDG
jgi:hypothetical protein